MECTQRSTEYYKQADRLRFYKSEEVCCSAKEKEEEEN